LCTDLTNRKSILLSNFSYQTAEFSNDILREVREELSMGVDQEHLEIKGSLNKEQRAGFNEIMDHVLNKKSQVFFVDGPGGTRKTFLRCVLRG